MKTLTLTQPWASLVTVGAKHIETCSWFTSYRGPLAIHAAKGFPRDARDFVSSYECRWALGPHFGGTNAGPLDEQLPLGRVLATSRLVACTLISQAFEEQLSDQERSFGNYEQGRFAWVLEDVKPLPDSDPAKGAPGLWEWDDAVYWKRREDFGPNGDAATPGFWRPESLPISPNVMSQTIRQNFTEEHWAIVNDLLLNVSADGAYRMGLVSVLLMMCPTPVQPARDLFLGAIRCASPADVADWFEKWRTISAPVCEQCAGRGKYNAGPLGIPATCPDCNGTGRRP